MIYYYHCGSKEPNLSAAAKPVLICTFTHVKETHQDIFTVFFATGFCLIHASSADDILKTDIVC